MSNALGLTQPSIQPDVPKSLAESMLSKNQPSLVNSPTQLTGKWPKSLTFNAKVAKGFNPKTNLVTLFSLLLLEKPRWLPQS